MTIQTIYEYDEDEWREHWALDVDGERKITLYAPESEDATISRDLKFVRDIPALMQLAYEAGKAGETFTISKTEGEV